MKALLTLILLLSAPPAMFPAAGAPKAAGKPDVVLLISDQHFADAMSGAGYGLVKIPITP
jgi:hypothetical protein